MCPFTIDEKKMQQGSAEQILSLDPAKPPVKSIPHYHFPLAVYKHPVEKFFQIEHRNAKHELVDTEFVPTEHLTQVISCPEHVNGGPKACKACRAELEKAIDDGWVEEPYIPEAPPDPRARIYNRTEQQTA